MKPRIPRKLAKRLKKQGYDIVHAFRSSGYPWEVYDYNTAKYYTIKKIGPNYKG